MNARGQITAVLALCTFLSSATDSTGGAKGSKPATSAPQYVGPGHTGTNGDVTVENNTEHGHAQARISPPSGASDATSSTVNTDSSFTGTISSVEGGDTVVLGSNNTATVNTTGGSVTVGGGSVVTINNAGGPGATSTSVTTPGGTTLTLPPGSTVIVRT